MKKSVFVLMFILLGLTVRAQSGSDGSIAFEHSTWKELLEKAKKENKNIFVDVYTSWCGPCKKLAKNIFTQPAVGSFFNENFICYSLQMDPKDTEKLKEAKALGELYNIAAYPTLLWLTPEGKMLHYSVGFMEADELISTAKKALDPNSNSSGIMEKWAKGDHSLKSGLTYFEIKRDSLKAFDAFYLQLSKEDKLNPDLLSLMEFTLDLPAECKAVQYIAENRKGIFSQTPDSIYWDKIVQISLENGFSRKADKVSQDKIISMYKNYNLPYILKLRDKADCLKEFKAKNYDVFFKKLGDMVQNYPDLDYMHSITLRIGNKLADGGMKEVKAPKDFLKWVNMYIEKRKPKALYEAEYKLIAYSLDRNEAAAVKEFKKMEKEIELSKFSADDTSYYITEGQLLVKAVNR